jgi:hypothetical protein
VHELADVDHQLRSLAKRSAREPALFRRRSPVFDRPFLQCEQTIDVCHVRAEDFARFLAARRRVDEHAVLGAHAVGANVCVMPPEHVSASVGLLCPPSEIVRHRSPQKVHSLGPFRTVTSAIQVKPEETVSIRIRARQLR